MLERSVKDYYELTQKVEDSLVLLDMAEEASDEQSFKEVLGEIKELNFKLNDLELKSLLNGETDGNSSYISIHAGNQHKFYIEFQIGERYFHLW